MDNQKEHEEVTFGAKLRTKFGKNTNDCLDLPIVGKLTARAVVEFVFVAAVIIAICLAAYSKIGDMLNDALENAVERNARTAAYDLNKQFTLELSNMTDSANLIKTGKITPQNLIVSLNGSIKTSAGILRPDGSPVAGDPPPERIIWACKEAYAGKPVVRYLRDIGLVFAVPVDVEGTDCILFDYYDDDAVRERFHTISYSGDGTVFLFNNVDDWTVIADGIIPLATHPEVYEGRKKLAEKYGFKVGGQPRESSGSIIYKFHDVDCIIYYAIVSKEFNFSIAGYVPWKSVAVGLDAIYAGMLMIFGLIFLLTLMGGRAFFKSRENEQLRKENSLALQASRTKSDFLSNMSHEIRTPINAILGMDEMILREAKEEAILEYAQNLRTAGNSLLGIVNDILDFSKIESGKMEIINVEYSLGSLLNDLVNMIQTRAEKKKLQFIVKADPKLPTGLYGDEIRLKQIITNILTNAVKYTEEGSVTLEVKAVPRDDNSIWLCVAVTDTGIGIKNEDLTKLFNAFERIEEKRNRTVEGTGLGMNITEKLLRLMESHLAVSSVYGKGSTFKFKVAQRIVNPEPLGDFEEAFKRTLKNRKAYHEKFVAPDAKILVVDDTVMNLTVVKGLLKQTKIQIETAESGYDCLKLVAQNKYDVIFLDHRMPGIDGIETLQKMQAMPESKNLDTPVISLTANAISGARETYIAAGFKDYLTKPIDADALENMLIKYLPPEKVGKSEGGGAEVAEVADAKSILPEWLGKVDGIDAAAGVAHCGGEDSYMDVLKVFAEAVEPGAAEIQKFFDERDWKNYTTKVHALKSTSKVIGAAELSDRAKRLEDAGNAGDVAEIEKSTPALLELYKSYAEKLSPLIEKVSDDDKPDIDPDALAEAYETIREVSASFDYDTLTFVLQSLEEYKLPPADAEKFKALKAAAAKLDWDAVKAACE